MRRLFREFRAEFGTSQFRVEVLGYALALSIVGLCLVGVAVVL